MSGPKIIFRTRHTSHFVTLPNAMVRDKRLSFKARGILAMVLSHADEWQVNNGWLESQGTEGREAISSAMSELEAHGYAVFFEEREKGIITACYWTFYDAPVPDTSRSNRTKWNKSSGYSPCNGNPCNGITATSEDHLSENHKTQNKKQKNTPQPPQAGECAGDSIKSKSEHFEAFWETYPRKTGKDAAEKAWVRKKCDEQSLDIMLALDLQKESHAWRRENGRFIPHPATWINQGRWKDEVKAPAQKPADQPKQKKTRAF